MTTTRSTQSESVAARVRRHPRAAAVDARRRLSDMAEEAFEQNTYVRPAAVQVQAPSAAPVYHRYMLRSMRRQQQ